MNKAIGQKWEDIEQEIFTPEEIAESDLRVAVICKFIKARNEKRVNDIGNKLPSILLRQQDFNLFVVTS